MTEDHIFPKGISTPQQRQVIEILKTIAPNRKERPHSRLFQNGLTKRTLCGTCNNSILGSFLDPALIDICSQISRDLRNIHFLMTPTVKATEIQLNKVARAVAGHFIAADDTPQWRHPMIKALRRYILRLESPFPPEYRFQMWLYPFKQQAVLKDLFHTVFGSGYEPFGISAYKTYPLAFSFSREIKNPAYKLEGIVDLSLHLKGAIDRKSSINIWAKLIVDPNWPYAPHKNGAILASDNGSVKTNPYMNKRKYPY